MGINCLQLLWARHFWRAHFLLPHLLERYYFALVLLRRIGRFRGVGCRDRFHKATDLLSRTSLHIVGDVRIGVQRKPDAEVAQHTGQGFHIHAAGDGHGREGVSEVMKAHMLLDACAFQQLPVDPRHGVRTPVTACAGRREQDGVVQVLLVLLYQQVYRLLRQRHLADRVFRFWFCHIQLALHAGDLLIHRQDALFYIQVLPLECQQFAPAQAAGQLQIEHGQNAVFFRFLEVSADLFRWEDGHLFLVLGRDAAVLAGVVRDEPLFHRLLQRRLQHRMDTPHEGVGQGFVILFRPTGHPAVFFQVVIHSLDVDGRELFKLDRTDGRDDVVLDDPLIALGGIVADVGLAVSLKPQAAPLRYGVVAHVIDRNAPVFPNGFRQLFLALRLGLGGHTFLDSLAGDWVMPWVYLPSQRPLGFLRMLPSPLARFFAIYDPSFFNTNTYHRISEIAITIFRTFL